MTNEDRTLAARPSVGRGFWSAAVAITAIVLSANTPLPLLTVYQSQWGFSTALLSIVYGLYTVGVVTTVFLVGPMSDHVGRKRILIPSLFLMALGLVTSLLSPNVWVLMGGRVLQGLAVGAEFGPAPTVLPYLAALLFVFVTLIAVARAPETVVTLGPLALRPARIRIPLAIAPAFYLATYVELTAYAVASTFAGLGASFAKVLLGIQGHFAAGLVVALLFLASATGQLMVRRWPPRRAMQVGLLTIVLGLACFAGALVGRSGALFFLSAVILGAGHGLAYLGSQELTDRIAPAQSRAEVLSGFQLGLYVEATVPAVVVGFAAKALGFETATLFFAGVIAALAMIGLVWIRTSPVPALQA